MPVTSPPCASTVSAITAIRPSSEPPYTRRLPLPAIHAPNSSTAFLYDGSLPSWAPRYTVMFIYRLSNVIALFDPLTVVPTIR